MGMGQGYMYVREVDVRALITWQTPYVMYRIDASVILSVTPGVRPR